MHAVHCFAHRAPPPMRTRFRWKPYDHVLISSPPPLIHDLATPLSVSNTPSVRPIKSSIITHSKDVSSAKAKFTLGLVEQAVKILSDFWRPQDIPINFVYPQCIPNTLSTSVSSYPLQRMKTSQLPSPSPSSPPSSPSPKALCSSLRSSEYCTTVLDKSPSALPSLNPLVPIKIFVHEVLRRSRTSACVLQTALCYLEAIGPKVPGLAQEELFSVTDNKVLPVPDRISLPEEYEPVAQIHLAINDPLVNTVRVTDEEQFGVVGHSSADTPIPDLMPLVVEPRLPSPLLCPRRTFLASLILASKFIQDKCHSNRAWAKLSGLSPSEITRCEHALGQALQWRLWVGKRRSAASMSSSVAGDRPVVRSQTMSSLSDGPLIRSSFFAAGDNSNSVSESSLSSTGGLRRCATLPANVYAAPTLPLLASTHRGTSLDNGLPFPIQPISPDDSNKQFMDYSQKITNHSEVRSSLSPDTPGLTHSPSSAGSSLGDRTIQMTTFFEDGFLVSNVLPTPNSWDACDFTAHFAKGSPPDSIVNGQTHTAVSVCDFVTSFPAFNAVPYDLRCPSSAECEPLC